MFVEPRTGSKDPRYEGCIQLAFDLDRSQIAFERSHSDRSQISLFERPQSLSKVMEVYLKKNTLYLNIYFNFDEKLANIWKYSFIKY